ncbi:hypothetical protein NP493_185g04021 [Ridgeia piscesae]|uniref:Uncharacterized protein n=1 Tax=Ridgeia piscesae TaxID=27915 RepID=A0AAD9UF00_RIDPI|nr:hypothetical protein NP493_185g04021 [Ridgeia piscesae]
MHVAGRALSIRDNNTGSTSASRFTIGTFITCGLSSATKRGQLTGDLGRLHVDICCPLETKSPGGFDARSGNYLLLGQQSQPRTRLRRLLVGVSRNRSNSIAANNSQLTIVNAFGRTSQRVDANNFEQDKLFAQFASLTPRHSSQMHCCTRLQEMRRLGSRHLKAAVDGSTRENSSPSPSSSSSCHSSQLMGEGGREVSSNCANKALAPWCGDTVKHFWHCAKTAGGSVERFKAEWRGVIHHTVNRHEWQIGGGVSAGQCSHGPLEEDHDKAWLEQGSPAHKPWHTGELEAFHHHILMYAAKLFTFSYPVYVARTQLAAIDFQKHKDRPYHLNAAGEMMYKRMYSKKSGNWYAVPIKTPKTYNYIIEMQMDAASESDG